MTGVHGPLLFSVKQKATAEAKDYRVFCGFRPAAILMWQSGDTGNMWDGLWVDAVVDSDGTAIGGGVSRSSTSAHVLSNIASGGITPHDDGFTFGQDAFFKTNGQRLTFLVFRTAFPIEDFDLADVTADEGKNYGSGELFDKDASPRPPISIHEVS